MLRKLFLAGNPIIVKELRSKMRGARPFITMTSMLVILAGVTYSIYRLSVIVMGNNPGMPISPQIGQALFTLLAFLLLLFILIITPAETSGAISGEKEQLTYEMLLSTPMHPAKILSGKLFSALSYIFLLIFSAIPIASLIFMFGGVSLRDMLKTLIALIAVAVTLGVFGIFMSSLFQRSSRATVISYIIITVIVIGSLIAFIISGIITNGYPPRWILVINPFSTLASAMTSQSYSYNSVLGFIPILGADLSTIRGDTFGIGYIPRPLYHYSLPFYGLLSIVLYFISSRLILPTRKWRIPRSEILIFMAAVLGVLSITAAGFLLTTDRYEQAAADPTTQPIFAGPFIEKPIEQVAVAVEVKPAELVDPPQQSSTLTIEDQVSLYAEAITDSVMVFASDRGLPVERLFLVSTILDTNQDGSYTYDLPEPIQLAVLEQVSTLYPDVQWVASTEDVFNNPNRSFSAGDFVLNLGDTQLSEDKSISLYVAINISGAVERQTVYSFVLSNSGSWKIDSEERVFDAKD